MLEFVPGVDKSANSRIMDAECVGNLLRRGTDIRTIHALGHSRVQPTYLKK